MNLKDKKITILTGTLKRDGGNHTDMGDLYPELKAFGSIIGKHPAKKHSRLHKLIQRLKLYLKSIGETSSPSVGESS